MVENLDYKDTSGVENDEAKAMRLIVPVLSEVLGKSVETIREEVNGSLVAALLLCSANSDQIRIVRKTAEMDEQILEDEIAKRYAAGAKKVVVLEVF